MKTAILAALSLTILASGALATEASQHPTSAKKRVRTLGIRKPIKSISGAGLTVSIVKNNQVIKGTYISRISPRSRLFQAGLRPTNIVIAVNGKSVNRPEEFDRLLSQLNSQPLELEVAKRNGQSFDFKKLSTRSTRLRRRLPLVPVVSFKTRKIKHKQVEKPQEKANLSQTENTKQSVASISELEAQMIELVNKEREKRGIHKLTPDKSLADVARGHSSDMRDRKFFSHVNPDGKGPFARAKDARIRFRYIAENISVENWDRSKSELVKRSHKALMNSKGHRENILNPNISNIGIGIVSKGNKGILVTQLYSLK